MDELTIKSNKLKLGKKFIIALIPIILVLVAIVIAAFAKFQTYMEYQDVAVSLTLALSDEFDGDKNDYNTMVEKMYNFYAPSYYSFNYKGTTINNKSVVEAARKADNALGNAMTELGYSCSSGSRFLQYTNFFEWFVNYYYDSVDMLFYASAVCAALILVVLLLCLAYSLYKYELVIDGDTILCKRGKKTTKQFMIKDVQSVQNKPLSGIKISGSGLKYSILLVKNRAEIQQFIMNKVALLAEKTEQNFNAAANTVVNTVANTVTTEDLKNFKELLDNGIISQEEFDAKKKQLLGL